jgi:hypothetical protein
VFEQPNARSFLVGKRTHCLRMILSKRESFFGENTIANLPISVV